MAKNYQTFYKLFFFFCIYTRYLISAEWYEKADVHILIIKKNGEIWVSVENSHNGLGVKNMSDLVLKKYMVFIKQKTVQMNKLKNTKWSTEIFLKNVII